MRVKIMSDLPGMGLSPGDEEDFPAEDALRLIKRGFAVPVAPPIERAVEIVPETRGPAVNSKGGRSGGSVKRKK